MTETTPHTDRPDGHAEQCDGCPDPRYCTPQWWWG